MRVPVTRRGRRAVATRDERGGVLAIVVILIVPLLLLGAFTVDLGMAYAQAQAFSAGADSAALAIVKAKQDNLNANPSGPSNCQSLIASDAGRSLALARKQTDANRPYNLKASTGQVDVQVQLSCVDEDGHPDPNGVLRAGVTVQRDVPTTLGRLAGVDSVKASRAANAGLGAAKTVGAAFPLAICDAVANEIMANAATTPYPIEIIDVDKVWKADCSTKNGSGNWAWVHCGNGTQELAKAIKEGCPIDLTLTGAPPTITVEGQPGNKIDAGPVGDALKYYAKGNVFAFPVYDKITGKGAGTEYRIIGFINLRFVDWDKDGSVQVQYVSYSPVGEINPACGIGSGVCSPYNSWVIGLTG